MRSKSLLCLTFTAVASPFALATDFHSVASGNWYTAATWNPATVPQGGGGNHAFVDGGNVVSIAQDTDGGGSGFDIQDTFVGAGNGNSGTVNQTAGVFNMNNGWMFIGQDGGTGTWNMSGSSSIVMTGSGNTNMLIIVGRNTGSTGTLNLTGSSSISIDTIFLGGHDTGGTGTLDANTTGTINLTGDMVVGNQSGTGTATFRGGSSASVNRLYVGGTRDSGGAGNGTLTVNTTGTVTSRGDFSVGTQGGTGTVTMTAGTLNANSWAIIGESQGGKGGSVGSMVQNGGAVNFGATDANGRFWLGNQENGSTGPASSGSYTLNNGTLTSRNISLGHGGAGYSGTFTQTGGTYTILGSPDDSRIADGVGSTGTWNMSGGTATIQSHWQVGASGSGTFNQTGGTMDHNGAFPVIGRFNGGTGVATISGGNFNQNGTGQRLIIGEEGTGTLTVSGTGSVRSDGGISVGHLGTGNGTVNINTGGTVQAPWIGRANGAASINFNGGTFKAASSQSEILPVLDGVAFTPTAVPLSAANVELKAGGGKIDSNGFTVATGVAFDGVGSLTKLGAGSLTLNGVTTNTGGTFVSGGTLVLGASGGLSGTGQIDVAAGATLDASATGLTLTAGQSLTGKGTVTGAVGIGSGILAPGNSIGTLSFTGNVTLSPSSVSNFEISKTPSVASDLLSTTGILTLAGTLNVTSLGGTFVNGDTFNLLDASSFTGNFATVNLPAPGANSYWDTSALKTAGTITFIPEAGSGILLGLAGLGALARRRRNS